MTTTKREVVTTRNEVGDNKTTRKGKNNFTIKDKFNDMSKWHTNDKIIGDNKTWIKGKTTITCEGAKITT